MRCRHATYRRRAWTAKAPPHAVRRHAMLVPKGPAGWMACPRPGRQGGLPCESGVTTPGRRPAMLQARRAHWRPVAARDQLRSIGRCCARRRATGPSLQVGRFSVGQQCVSHISCGRCWAAPRTSDRKDVAGRLDAGEQHAAVGLNAGPANSLSLSSLGASAQDLPWSVAPTRCWMPSPSSAPLTGTIRLFRIRSGLLTVPAGFQTRRLSQRG